MRELTLALDNYHDSATAKLHSFLILCTELLLVTSYGLKKSVSPYTLHVSCSNTMPGNRMTSITVWTVGGSLCVQVIIQHMEAKSEQF